jgi:hypothetical protein
MVYNGSMVAVAQRDQCLSRLPVVKMWVRQASITAVAMSGKLSVADLWHRCLRNLSDDREGRVG